MNSELRYTVVAGIYTWNVRVLHDLIKRNEVICYLKDQEILCFLRIQSRHKVKKYKSETQLVFCCPLVSAANQNWSSGTEHFLHFFSATISRCPRC